MKKISYILSFLVLAASLTACDGVRRSDVGLIGGGLVGGVVGSAVTGGSTVGTIVGATGGALIGRSVTRRPHYYYY